MLRSSPKVVDTPATATRLEGAENPQIVICLEKDLLLFDAKTVQV